jgi:acyl-CoA dehydrogenase
MGRHQEISFKLADSMVFQETARMLIDRCVWLLEQKDPQAPVLASAAKAFAAESAVKAASHAVQIFGQEGVCAGNRAERFYRDARLMEILGDPTEKHRMFLADRVLQEY